MWRLRALVYDLRRKVMMWFWLRGYKGRRAERLAAVGRDYDSRELAKHENVPCDVTMRLDGEGEEMWGCPRCGAPVQQFGGMVGEDVLMCTREGCRWGWEDEVGAVARMI